MRHHNPILVIALGIVGVTPRLAIAQPATAPAVDHIVLVTSLEDYPRGEKPIPGTLRYAVDNSQPPCTIRFVVSGTIQLRDKLVINRPFITLDGSTAPGDGITIQRHQVEITNTHDITVSYLRFRCGDGYETEAEREKVHGKYRTLTTEGGSGGWRSLAIEGERKKPATDIQIDHCSIQNSTDDNGSVWNDCRRIVFRYCIFSGGYGKPTKAFLAGAEPTHAPPDEPDWLTIDHCLLARTDGRAPDIAGGTCQFLNNVIAFQIGGARFTNAKANVVGNQLFTLQNHPWTRPDRLLTVMPGRALRGGLYVAENLLDGQPCPDEKVFGVSNTGQTDLTRDAYRASPWPNLPPHAPPARIIREVLQEAGCSKPRRDAHDRHIVEDVARRAGITVKN